MNLILIAALLMGSGQDLEIAGDLMEAGIAYTGEADAAGQVRILCEYLEESLYAGCSDHALQLILHLEMFQLPQEHYDMWYARLAWSCGLAEYASAQLELVNGSPWITSRCRGLACLYRGNSADAAGFFLSSFEYAESVRQEYYSLLDLGFALVQQGELTESEELALYLSTRYPERELPVILLALSKSSQGRYGEGMSILQTLYSSSNASGIMRRYSRSLLREME